MASNGELKTIALWIDQAPMPDGISETTTYTFDKDLDNRLDFGLLVGGGFEYRFNFGKISAEARYTIGLGDIDKEKGIQSEVSQFRIIAVLVRYTISFGKKD